MVCSSVVSPPCFLVSSGSWVYPSMLYYQVCVCLLVSSHPHILIPSCSCLLVGTLTWLIPQVHVFLCALLELTNCIDNFINLSHYFLWFSLVAITLFSQSSGLSSNNHGSHITVIYLYAKTNFGYSLVIEVMTDFYFATTA